MEEQQTASLFDLQIDDAGASYLKETTRWSKFVSIVIGICIVIGVCVFFVAGPAILGNFQRLGYTGQMVNLAGGALMIIITIIAVIAGVLIFALYNFSVQVKKAVDHNDQLSLEKGIASLKNYFLISGIISAVSLVFVLLGLFIPKFL